MTTADFRRLEAEIQRIKDKMSRRPKRNELGFSASGGIGTLAAPDDISASSTNSVTPTLHTHYADASYDPGAAASLLETDANGLLMLEDLGIADTIFHKGDINTIITFTNDQISIDAGGLDMIDIVESGTPYNSYVNFPIGYVFINDTSNAQSIAGLTINEGGLLLEHEVSNNFILTFKSSEHAHSYSFVEPDTFGWIESDFIQEGALGGMIVNGISDSNQRGALGLYGFAGSVHTSTGLNVDSIVQVRGWYESGGIATAIPSNGNLFSVGSSNIQLILKGNGDLFINGSLYDMLDTDTGVILNTNDSITIQAGGVNLMNFVEGATDYVESLVEFRAQGNIYVEGNIFDLSDQDTGIIFGGTDVIGLQTNGTENLQISGGNVYISGNLYDINDQNTGIIFDSDDTFSLQAGGVTMIDIVEAATDYVAFPAGLVFINETSNANQGQGMAIKGNGRTDEMFVMKDSSVAHSMISETETDTYFYIKRGDILGAGGWARLFAFGDFNSGGQGIDITAAVDGPNNTPGSQIGVINLVGQQRSTGGDTTIADPLSSTDLLLTAMNDTSPVLTLRANGSLYLEGNIYDQSDQNTGVVFGGTDSLSIQAGGVTMLDIVEGATDYINVTQGLLFVNETANANQTIGITVKGGDTYELMTFKVSGLDHGMTNITEADTFGIIRANSGGSGTLQVRGLSSGTLAMNFITHATGEVTTTSTTTVGNVNYQISVKSGLGSTSLGAGAALMTLRNLTSTTHIFTSDGDIDLDGTANDAAFDDYDDAVLARAMQTALADPANIIRSKFDEMVRYNKDDLTKAGLITIDETGHTFISLQQSIKLLLGAVWQQQTKIYELEERLTNA